MYIRGQQFYGGDGIVTKGVEETLKNVGRLGKEGMKENEMKRSQDHDRRISNSFPNPGGNTADLIKKKSPEHVLWCVQGSFCACAVVCQSLSGSSLIITIIFLMNMPSFSSMSSTWVEGRDLAGIFQLCGDPVAGCVPCIFYSIF